MRSEIAKNFLTYALIALLISLLLNPVLEARISAPLLVILFSLIGGLFGSGRLNFYDQAPNQRGPINHLGINVRDLPELLQRMQAGGVAVPGGLKEADLFRYAMVSGPDGVLLELFEFDAERTPEPLHTYFDLPKASPA